MNKKLVLIDGHSILSRAFYGVPDLTNNEGLHTNGIYGFINILMKILDEEHPDYLVVSFDLKAPTFRHIRYKPYKGTRKPMPTELVEQVPVLKEVLQAMNIRIMEKAGYEADDLLGTMAVRGEQAGMDVSLVSGDHDMLQLATKKIKIRIPNTRHGTTTVEDYYEDDVFESLEVTPKEFIDVKALMGDTSDNIPGLPGVGKVTATKLIKAYHTIENVYNHLDEIKPNKAKLAFEEHYDLAQLSKELATIDTAVPLELTWDEAKMEEMYTPKAYAFYKKLEFTKFLAKFDQALVSKEMPLEIMEIRTIKEWGDQVTKLDQATEIGLCVNETGLGVAIIGMNLVVILEDEMERKQVERWVLDYGEKHSVNLLGLKRSLAYIPFPEDDQVFDNQLATYLLNPLNGECEYDQLGSQYMDMMIPTAKEVDDVGALAWEAKVALEAKSVIVKQLIETKMMDLYNNIEFPLIYVLYDMEREGMLVRSDELKAYGERLQVRIIQLQDAIYELAGEEFNINSPKQMGVVLFEHMELPGGKKTKTGYSTAASVLDKLAPEYEVVQAILEYRQLAKLKSTYADGLANYIETDGRIHSVFNQMVTATGRISSSEPNLQNIPIRMELGRELRKVFVPKEGFTYVDADYSQIELRVLAHMSGDEALIQAYKEAQDIHALTAASVFHVPFAEVTSLQRRNAKAVNFGIIYGISSFGLGRDLSITRKEAGEYIKRYFEAYPQIKIYLDELVKQAKIDGYVTTMFGRRRPIPELSSGNFMQRSFGERIAMNSPIQGTAADIMKLAMVKVNKRLKKEKLKSKLILQVHDELLIETANDEIKKVYQILMEEMEQVVSLSVKLEIDVHEGPNWYEVK